MKKIRLLIIFGLIGALCISLFTGRRNYLKPNFVIFPDMMYSPAYSAQSANPIFDNHKTLQDPVPDTIPRGYLPKYSIGKDPLKMSNPLSKSLDNLEAGKQIFENFCMHCHGVSASGNGPVAKTIPAFAMAINGPSTYDLADSELFRIITDGRKNMPSHRSQISQEERWQVILYLRELQETEKSRLAAQGIIHEKDPRPDYLVSTEYGQELFQKNCVPCHGEEGRTPRRGIPTLNNKKVLSIAPEDFYRDIITHGRTGTMMPAWGQVLTSTQIKSLVQYIRSWIPANFDSSEISVQYGDIHNGAAIYRGNCAACHGPHGEGGIGNSLNTPSFLAMASDGFLRDTIAKGRSHTAMPSGYAFSNEEISDLMAYIRSWSKPKSTYENVNQLIPQASEKIGKKIFEARCASCHGISGDGGIGPKLNNNQFLSIVNNRFLYRAIVEGRPDTAMPSWHFLEDQDVADVIKYIRTWQESESVILSDSPRRGRAEFGEILYKQACQACHGIEGIGAVGSQIANKVFLSSVNDEFLWRTIAYGKDGTAMKGFLKGGAVGELMPMNSEDIDHIIAYMRHLELKPITGMFKRPVIANSLEEGKYVYEQKGKCASCHGLHGEGASGPSLGNPDFLKSASDGYLMGTILLGREKSPMQSYSRGGNVHLEQEDVTNVVAYIRNFENRKDIHSRRIPSTEQSIANGKLIFQSHCAACHGSDGKGPQNNIKLNGYAPSINNPEFLRAADDGFLLATIALGRPGTLMLPFAKGASSLADLSTNDIQSIVNYIRSWEEHSEKN